MGRVPVSFFLIAAVDEAAHGPHGQQKLPPEPCGAEGMFLRLNSIRFSDEQSAK